MIAFTPAVKLQCVERELSYRRRVYARLVAAGKMKSDQAEREIMLMESIVEDYRAIVHMDDLFGRAS